ncbi:hypothetical protein Hlac_3587 (plasmid) [Halorubrum lacusprofundi ATCC 49239]|uniref:Uncharacterized protein n=1 Tax=Halorubrum lacusprofundi (strain ATCC 49239 / DSM 5036 / JCM 8891 / ACAM 34) TaxID=416348 RepID=B9LXA3_HALLT|nr:hypothetical protein Hlac_3587 [Halorubrum lacusprofundi ATCC 49239]
MLVARFATLVRDCTVHIDHLSAEITLSAMTHLPSLDVKVFHFDIELMERTGRQPDEHLFAVVWITFLWRVREYPILAVLPVTTRTKRDRLGELVGDVVPFIVSKPGVMASWTWVLWVDIFALVGHTRIM